MTPSFMQFIQQAGQQRPTIPGNGAPTGPAIPGGPNFPTPQVPAPSTASASSSQSFLDSPVIGAGLAGGLALASSMLQAGASRDAIAAQLRAQLKLSEVQIEQVLSAARDQRGRTGLEATQLDPFAQQKSLIGLALSRSLAQQGPPSISLDATGQLKNLPNLGPTMAQFASDPALANAAKNFGSALATASPETPQGSWADSGLGAAGAGADAAIAKARTDAQADVDSYAAKQRAAIQQALAQQQAAFGGGGSSGGSGGSSSGASKALGAVGGAGAGFGLASQLFPNNKWAGPIGAIGGGLLGFLR